jgi:hypothetical protein
LLAIASFLVSAAAKTRKEEKHFKVPVMKLANSRSHIQERRELEKA